MKKLIHGIVIIFLLNCSVKKSENVNKIPPNLTKDEIHIINDFLSVELASDTYKNYKEYQYIVIQEAYKKSFPLAAYQYTYEDSYLRSKELKNHWILDRLEIKKIENKIKKEQTYCWKKDDFKNINVTIQKKEDFLKTIKYGDFINLPHRLILFLSRPLLIDSNNAFLSFSINEGDSGSGCISRSTILMKKVNNKWVIKEHYWDGVMH